MSPLILGLSPILCQNFCYQDGNALHILAQDEVTAHKGQIRIYDKELVEDIWGVTYFWIKPLGVLIWDKDLGGY